MPEQDPQEAAQLPLFEHGDAAPPTLDALVQRARLAAAKPSDGGAVGQLVARLARGDGSASVAGLQAEGFPGNVIVAAVSSGATDRRVKPRAKLEVVGGEPVVFLTTTGWQAAGFASKRERHPTAESAEHAAAPNHLSAWLRDQLEGWPGLAVQVVTGQGCRDFSERTKALAWSRIQGAGDATGGAGSLTGGLVPDALMLEQFPDAVHYAGAWGYDPACQEDMAEQTVALEIESTLKGDAPLRWKVDRWSAAIHLGATHAVVWVVRQRKVAEKLQALGVGKPGERQLLVPASALGLEGESMPDIAAQWWPLRLGETRIGVAG